MTDNASFFLLSLLVSLILFGAGCSGLFEDLDHLDFDPSQHENHNQISCDEGQTFCHGSCVNLEEDADYCGDCDTSCPNPEFGSRSCLAGQCVVQCQADFDACDLDCVDLNTDDDNCGGCGIRCNSSESCTEGRCLPRCTIDEECTESPEHSVAVCTDGVCSFECLGEHQRCDDKCVDIETDIQHCGGCHEVCDGHACIDGQCHACNPDNFLTSTADPQDYSFGGGSGTASDPFLICSPTQLADIDGDSSFWGAHFKLYADLDLAELTDFEGIGGVASGFSGTFDGNGLSLSNLRIDHSQNPSAGLFRRLDANAEVSNLRLLNFEVDSHFHQRAGALAGSAYNAFISDITVNGARVNTFRYGGGLIGESQGTTMENIEMTDVVVQSNALEAPNGPDVGHFGGLVGEYSGTINNISLQNIHIIGTNSVGGLVGEAGELAKIESVAITDLMLSVVDIIDDPEHVGGLAGQNRGEISSASVIGHIEEGIAHDAGGLVGLNHPSGTIVESHAHVSIDLSGGYRIGGLVGTNSGSIQRSFATGMIESGNFVVGGLVGAHSRVPEDGSAPPYPHQILDCYATGDVAGNSETGGFVGLSGFFGAPDDNMTLPLIQNSYSTGKVTGQSMNHSHRGFIGLGENAEINASYWDIETSIRTSGSSNESHELIGLISYEFSDLDQHFTTWDFTDTWILGQTSDGETRPILKWQSE